MEALDRAIAWQTTGPIRVDRPGSAGYGAFLHGFDKRLGRPMGLYTEITGYAVSLLTFLTRLNGGGRYRKMAEEAGDYLVGIQEKTGAYPHLPDPSDKESPWSAYAFDVSACIVGLVRLERISPGRGYIDSAMAACRWLHGMQRTDGSFSAMVLRDGRLRDPGGFFGDGSCIHAKNAIALLEVHAAAGRDEDRRAAVKICERTLELQAADGAFRCGPLTRHVFTHAHSYACEGLLFAGKLLGEERFVRAALSGIEWLAANQHADGGWLSYYKVAPFTRRRLADALKSPRPSDAAAQAVRLFHLAGARHDSARRAALEFLLGCQDAGGGFHYRRTRFGYSPFINTWSAQFAVQALAWNTIPAQVADLF